MAAKKTSRTPATRPPPADQPELTRKSTVEIFIKTLSEKRVAVDAVDAFLSRLNDLGRRVVQTATRSANADNRNTIMAKDIEAAFKTMIGGADTEGIFQSIHGLSAKDTAALAQKIQEFLKP